MRFELSHTLFIALLLLALILVIEQGFHPSRAFGQEEDNTAVAQHDKEIGGPIAATIRELRKAYLNPYIAESHGLDRDQATAACRPITRASRQTASALGERVGSGKHPKCMQSCMKGQSLDDAHAVLLCSSRCL